jgi:HAE1 family hydrophobic/amphiphilic exporter-1
MLIGLVCKNAIMLVDYTNQRRAAGESIRTALIQSKSRSFTSYFDDDYCHGFGMFPIALASELEQNGKKRFSMGSIGGLISSLFLTLVIVFCDL